MRIVLKHDTKVVIVLTISFKTSCVDVESFTDGYQVGGVFEWKKSTFVARMFGIRQPVTAYCVSVKFEDIVVGTFHVDCIARTIKNMVAVDLHSWAIVDEDDLTFNPYFENPVETNRTSFDNLYGDIKSRYKRVP
jgi:hypothetical protein